MNVEYSSARPGISQTVIRIAFMGLAATTLTGWISPPIALAAGLVFALALGNPIPDISHRASKLLLQWSVVGLGFGMNLPAVWSAGKTGFGFTVMTIWGTLLVGFLLGRFLKVESQTSTLVSVARPFAAAARLRQWARCSMRMPAPCRCHFAPSLCSTPWPCSYSLLLAMS